MKPPSPPWLHNPTGTTEEKPPPTLLVLKKSTEETDQASAVSCTAIKSDNQYFTTSITCYAYMHSLTECNNLVWPDSLSWYQTPTLHTLTALSHSLGFPWFTIGIRQCIWPYTNDYTKDPCSLPSTFPGDTALLLRSFFSWFWNLETQKSNAFLMKGSGGET